MSYLLFLMRFIIILLVIVVYYRLVVIKFGRFVVPIVKLSGPYIRLTRRYALSEVNSIVKLGLSGILQFLFCCLLILITGFELKDLVLVGFQPVLILYGILLGIGETALGNFLCYVSVRLIMKLVPDSVPIDLKDWLTMAKAGWMRLYLKTAETAPLYLVLLFTVLYISVEEMIFRGVLINYFLPAGNIWALGASMFFFMLVQVFHMPSWKSALFPLIGALLVGLLHGLLFLAVPNILPLLIAHFIFFLMALF